MSLIPVTRTGRQVLGEEIGSPKLGVIYKGKYINGGLVPTILGNEIKAIRLVLINEILITTWCWKVFKFGLNFIQESFWLGCCPT